MKMDCHAIATALARNDRVGRVDCRADFQSARNDRENNATSKKVDSSKNAKNVSKQPKDSKSEAQNLKTPAKDSRISTQNAPSVSDSQAAGLLIQTQNYKKWILGFAMRNLCFASRARR